MRNKYKVYLKKSTIIVSILLVVAFATMSVGYAAFSTELKAIGDVFIYIPNGETEVYIDSIEFTDSAVDSNVNASDISFDNIQNGNRSILNSSIQGSLGWGENPYFELTYTLINNTDKPQKLIDFISDQVLTEDDDMHEPRLLGIKVGDSIPANGTVKVKVIYFKKGHCNWGFVTANNTFIFSNENENVVAPSLVSSIANDELNVSADNVKATTDVSITNLYNVSVKYSLRLEAANVTLLNQSAGHTEYWDILFPGETFTDEIKFSVNLPAGESETGILYIITEDNTRYNVGSIKFSKGTVEDPGPGGGQTGSDGVVKPPSLPNVDVKYIVSNDYWTSNNGSDSGHLYAKFTIEVENTGNENLEDYSVFVNFSEYAKITEFHYYGEGIGKMDTDHLVFTINGLHQWNTDYKNTIPAHTKKEFGTFDFYAYADHEVHIDELIEYIVVTNGNGDTTPIRACTSSEPDYILTCNAGW